MNRLTPDQLNQAATIWAKNMSNPKFYGTAQIAKENGWEEAAVANSMGALRDEIYKAKLTIEKAFVRKS